MSRLQRLNLELQNLDEQNERTQTEIENIKKSLNTIEEDSDREKSIIVDATSNEKRLKEEKNELIEIDSKYYDTENKSNEDLDATKNRLKVEIDKVKELINAQKNDEAITVLDNCIIIIEAYAGSYSKYQNIKNDSIKRKQRISTIETEIESWRNLLINSEKMIKELTDRKKVLINQLNQLEKQPQIQAEKKGQNSENLRISEKEKNENEIIIEEIDKKINSLRSELNETQEKTIQIRERKASSGATIEGLK